MIDQCYHREKPLAAGSRPDREQSARQKRRAALGAAIDSDRSGRAMAGGAHPRQRRRREQEHEQEHEHDQLDQQQRQQRRRRRRPRPLPATTTLATLLALVAAGLLLPPMTPRPCAAQLSEPRAHDGQWRASGNKYLSRRADSDAAAAARENPYDDVPDSAECPLDVELRWATQVSSSVYATPLITDLYSDGRKDVVVPGFSRYAEVLQGTDGAKAPGWPAFHRSTVHAAPLMADWDLDGTADVVVATYDGEVLAFKDTVRGGDVVMVVVVWGGVVGGVVFAGDWVVVGFGDWGKGIVRAGGLPASRLVT